MEYYAHGKLLLTGEYTVLHGTQALAVPTKQGQSLKVTPADYHWLSWKGYTLTGDLWFEAHYEIENFNIVTTNHQAVAERLASILNAIRNQNPDFCKEAVNVTTQLEFNQSWGLGSSSTLLSCLSQWAGIDPYKLLDDTLGGSGYDIACAQQAHPILYQRIEGKPFSENALFNPPFMDELYFVYLNQKQDSQKEVAAYKQQEVNPSLINTISGLTQEWIICSEFENFLNLIDEHENLMADHLQRPRIQQKLFPDFKGRIKSLGAWGGDFILAAGGDTSYFSQKGYTTLKKYREFIL